MRTTVAAVLAGAALLVGGCGGDSGDEASPPTTSASSTAEPSPTDEPTTTERRTTTITADPSEDDPLLDALRDTCDAGDAYTDALAAFIDNGTGGSTAEELTPVVSSLAALARVLNTQTDPTETASFTEAVQLYKVGIDGLIVLYLEGETAYQASVPPSEREAVVHEEAEALWDDGIDALYDGDGPSAPTALDRTC